MTDLEMDPCGCGDPDCGWAEVADRMDRWAAAGYRGAWQDPEYDRPTDLHQETT